MPVRPTNALVVGAVVALAWVSVGCDSDAQPPHYCLDCPVHYPGIPQNDTPQNTMLRFKAAYQYQDITIYKNLLTADFRYVFSSQSDSALVARFGDNWGKDDEVESAQHLLTGFTNSQGAYVAPASSITLSFTNDQYLPDPAHSDSLRYFDYTPIATVSLDVDLPTASGTTTYNIHAQHNFYLVRGDAAVLDAGQPADSLHWYIQHWDDLAAPPAPDTAGVATTWGRLKARYR